MFIAFYKIDLARGHCGLVVWWVIMSVTKNLSILPEQFDDFIYNEPIKTRRNKISKYSLKFKRRTKMEKIITDLNLPDIQKLKQLCKSISALELIMEQEWEIRYYSYNPSWDVDEEVFEMKNGCGEEMLILFSKHGAVISGVNNECFDWENDSPKIENLAKGLPKQFDDFIYNEPIKTRKSTFCIWRTIADSEWQTGETIEPDGSEDILYLLDGNPEKYVEFCEDYYEKEIPLDIVERIYQAEPISLEMIYKLNDEIEDEDIEIIKNELEEIKYPNTL